MNVKRNGIEKAPVKQSWRLLQDPTETITRAELVPAFRTRDTAFLSRLHICVGLPSADHSNAESWEALCYAVLWLCGLIDIGLCFL
jgi:hypothetical protein